MKSNNLSANGLSLSQAQSISNLCNQRAKEIGNEINNVNNYSKGIEINNETHVLSPALPIPANVTELLKLKSELHACQAFLMENIKAKDDIIKDIRSAKADISKIDVPSSPIYQNSKQKQLPLVDEKWGWEQLTNTEINEYLEAEAHASHIGQYIHNGGTLDTLRKEIPTIPTIEWMEITKDTKTPVSIITHHTSKQLLELHEELATIHRQYEQKVNYFKAKVKNLVTNENARIAKYNADIENETKKINNNLSAEYEKAMKDYNERVNTLQAEYEFGRQEKIKEVANLRINVDPRFQKVVDMFLKTLDSEK